MEKTNEQIQAELAKPFTTILQDGSEVPDIKWKVNNTFQNQEGKQFAEITPYITAAQIKNRLNEVVGVFGWEVSFEEMSSDNGMICNLTVKGVSKSGIGTSHKLHDNIDKDKTKESDSLKRAAVGFGIGAYIKDVKNIILPYNKSKKFALSTDSKVELVTPEMLTAYINGISKPLLSLNFALQSISKEIVEANKKEITIVWNLVKNS